MFIYAGGWSHTYSPFADNDLFVVTFPDGVDQGSEVIVSLQWAKDGDGNRNVHSTIKGKFQKADVSNGKKHIQFFKNDNYYWYVKMDLKSARLIKKYVQ